MVADIREFSAGAKTKLITTETRRRGENFGKETKGKTKTFDADEKRTRRGTFQDINDVSDSDKLGST